MWVSSSLSPQGPFSLTPTQSDLASDHSSRSTDRVPNRITYTCPPHSIPTAEPLWILSVSELERSSTTFCFGIDDGRGKLRSCYNNQPDWMYSNL